MMAPTVRMTQGALVLYSMPLFTKGGAANQWARTVANELFVLARAYAPHPGGARSTAGSFGPYSTGALQKSIRREFNRRGKVFDTKVWATVPYAKFVHEGTKAQGRNYIYSQRGRANTRAIGRWVASGDFRATKDEKGLYLKLPPHPRTKQIYFLRVRGQKANPFLDDAYHAVSVRHDALPKRRLHRHTLV